ncbi:hypothetical protein MKQ70_27985 [Chitinophaga sedimenti]|uniref:hypothetical protein n=1 Tax=Chitinophaga sedimenti TaxID=2033606 RepID=UPI002003D0A0|nr:hypothetical protein [Chitinophaga sedimenti]MCK7558628.1 hypothetical protein [Chitinophaga sedimenti]
MPKRKVTDFASLELEIARLENRKRMLEGELEYRVDYFKDNYKSMAMNSLVPGLQKSGVFGAVGNIAKLAWSSTGSKNVLKNVAMTALEFVAVRFGIKLFNKYTHRRKKKRADREAGEA